MSKKKAFQGKLPDGNYTTSATLYIKEWKSVTDLLEREYRLRVIGLDPGVLVCDMGAYTEPVTLPMWLVTRLIAKVPMLDRLPLNKA